MLKDRTEILERVRLLAGGRPVRWVDEKTCAGDFDGRDWTVEIFDVARADRLLLREQLWELFDAVRMRTGNAMSLITHTPDNTTSFYPWVRSEGVEPT